MYFRENMEKSSYDELMMFDMHGIGIVLNKKMEIFHCKGKWMAFHHHVKAT